MERREVRSYIARLIESHKKRVKPKGPEHMTQVQRNLYETIKRLVNEKHNKILKRKDVEEKYEKTHHVPMNLLPSDFCYNLVNVGPDFECKFLMRLSTG